MKKRSKSFGNNWRPQLPECKQRGALIAPFLIIMLWFFAWHFSKALVDHVVVKRSWNRLVSYAIGVVVAWPTVAMMLRAIWHLRGLSDEEIAALMVDVYAAYHGAYLAAGFGTAIGWAVWDGK